MAEYEHICEACGFEWTACYSIKEDPPKICPKCNKKKAKRLISSTSFVLIGQGWAKEGYSNK